MNDTYKSKYGYRVKKFDAERYVKYDGPGKNAAVSLFKQLQANGQIASYEIRYVEINTGVFADASITMNSGSQKLVDIEVKTFWNHNNRFSLTDFHIPRRKEKPEYNDLSLHLLFSNDLCSACFVKRSVYLKSPSIVKKCKYIGLDSFRVVPRTETLAIYHFEDNIWRKE